MISIKETARSQKKQRQEDGLITHAAWSVEAGGAKWTSRPDAEIWFRLKMTTKSRLGQSALI